MKLIVTTHTQQITQVIEFQQSFRSTNENSTCSCDLNIYIELLYI